jgi:hypothetical protein
LHKDPYTDATCKRKGHKQRHLQTRRESLTHTHRIGLAWRIIVFRHEYVRLHTCENVSMCAHENVRICMYVHVRMCVHVHMRACVHVCMRVCVYVCASGMQRS